MNRREFIVTGIAILPQVTFAQSTNRTRLVGSLGPGVPHDPVAVRTRAAFEKEISDLGWIVGQNLRIERRFARGDPGRANELAKELVELGPDVILAVSSLSVAALARQTRTIPTVFVLVSVPIAQGYIANMARPGGNLTGFTNFTDASTVGKLMELLKEILPSVSRVALMINPETTGLPQGVESMFQSIDAAAASFGIEPIRTPVRSTAEIESTIAAFAHAPNSGMIVLPDNFMFIYRELVIGTVARYRLPAVYPYGFWAREGGLIGFGNDLIEPFRLAAGYVDRILRGSNPGELPVQQPTKFELVINFKTANALGLTVPPTLLVRANEVIE